MRERCDRCEAEQIECGDGRGYPHCLEPRTWDKVYARELGEPQEQDDE